MYNAEKRDRITGKKETEKRQNLPGEMKPGEFWYNFDNAKKASPQGFNLG